MTIPERSFPETVKSVRKALNISQEGLARELGMSFSTVNRWENGKTEPVGPVRDKFNAFCTKMTRQGKLDKDHIVPTIK
jgi:putative transcriptional regulator